MSETRTQLSSLEPWIHDYSDGVPTNCSTAVWVPACSIINMASRSEPAAFNCPKPPVQKWKISKRQSSADSYIKRSLLEWKRAWGFVRMARWFLLLHRRSMNISLYYVHPSTLGCMFAWGLSQ